MGNSASSLPYSIGKQVCFLDHGWALHEGQQKSDGRAVSVFVAKKPALNKTAVDKARKQQPQYRHLTQLRPALHHFAVCRKLRHPQILTVHATLDTDNPSESSGASGAEYQNSGSGSSGSNSHTGDLIIVTEACIPLEQWMNNTTNPPSLESRAWGLESVCRALHFMHASANLAHGNLCPASLFVTRAGDVKLFNFACTTNVAAASGGLQADFKDYEALLCPMEYRSPERQAADWQALEASNATHAMDSYSVAILIHYLYQGHVPQALQKATQRLQTPNIKMRPRLQPLLKCPVFDTPYQKIQLQLQEFAVQDVQVKIGFWKNLTPSLQAGLYPAELAAYKIFPLMQTSLQTICASETIRTQDLYRREVLAMLIPLFYIAEHYLGQEEFSRDMGPLVTMLFTINDRGVRGSLLKKAPLLVKHLDNNALNVNCFEPMCSGFSDSSAALRELTLQATGVLVPHLTQPNLEKLSRYLVRLQADTEDSIRTKTVIFFAKLAPHLTEISRQKMLLPALQRGMKDVTSPTRLAALQAVVAVKKLFSPMAVASQVVPAVAPCLVDPAAAVRKEAFSIMEDLLFVLRQESQRLAHLPEAPEQSGGNAATTLSSSRPVAPPGSAPAPPIPAPAPAATSSSTSYFSSWMSSSSGTTPVAPASAAAPPPPPVVQPPTRAMANTSLSAAPRAPVVTNNNHTTNDDSWGVDDDDGWGDEDDDINLDNDLAMRNIAALPVSAPLPGIPKAARGKLVIPGAKTSGVPKPAVQKLSLDESVDDGWDDF